MNAGISRHDEIDAAAKHSRRIMRPSPSAPAPVEITCSEWLDELTTARDSIVSVRLRVSPWISDEQWYALYRAMEVLEKLIDAEPSRSSSVGDKP